MPLAADPGIVTAIGPAPPSSSGAPSSETSQLTVTPSVPSATGTAENVPVQVSLTTTVARNVLAVPISALLALAGGGYGVDVVEPSGIHRLVGVTTGTFASSRVEISGNGLRAGMRVVVAQ